MINLAILVSCIIGIILGIKCLVLCYIFKGTSSISIDAIPLLIGEKVNSKENK